MGLCMEAQALTWLDMLLREMGVKALTQAHPLTLFGDNQASLKMAQEGADTTRTKHIDIRIHYTREHVEGGLVKIIFVKSKNNEADIFEKNVTKELHKKYSFKLMEDVTSEDGN